MKLTRSSALRARTLARLLARRSGWLELRPGAAEDVTVKPGPYLPVYEELLRRLRTRRFSLLELGVWKGDSIAMWRNAFPRATIVGLDLAPPDLNLGRRVHLVKGDQSDAELLDRIRMQHAPDGFEVIIDDASHIGDLSARSLKALYPRHLRPGGLYIIEDWGTGYVPGWDDGGEPSAVVGVDQLDDTVAASAGADGTARRMPSHDCGLVGLVKRLVDHTAAGTLGVHQPKWIADPLSVEWMRVQDGLVILKKR